MPSLTSAAVVAAIALLVPLGLVLTKVRVPEIAVQILFGVLIGPQVLAWASVDPPVRILSTVGLAFLLLLAGLEIDLRKMHGRVLSLTVMAFAASFALALVAGAVLGAGGLVRSPLLIAVIFSATSLGVIVPVLEDAGEAGSACGQLIVAAGSVAKSYLSFFCPYCSASTALASAPSWSCSWRSLCWSRQWLLLLPAWSARIDYPAV